MALLPVRDQVLRLYARIFRVARHWQAADVNETKVERNYIEKYTLQLSNETSWQHWHDMAVDIPPR